jgi:hypothetical protein
MFLKTSSGKALTVAILSAFFIAIGSWLSVKLRLSASTRPYMIYWNESRSCYINAYIPKFSSFGVPGKLVKLFSSDSFFRIYRKDGTLLKSSEWLLWQREFAESEKAIWVNGRAIYPTNSGYEGWALQECG